MLMNNESPQTSGPYRPGQPNAGMGKSMSNIHRLLRQCMGLIDGCDLLQGQCSIYLTADVTRNGVAAGSAQVFGKVIADYGEFIRKYEEAVFLFVANNRNTGGELVARFHQEKFMELYLLLQKKYVTILKLYELVVVSRHRPAGKGSGRSASLKS